MFSYFYQIVGGILIFVSSLVGEDLPVKWKKRSYAVFAFMAIAYSGIGISVDRYASGEQAKLQQKVSVLQSSFDQSEAARKSERDASEKARQSDRDAFLTQFNGLNNQVSAVRANVQTEGLRKQLDNTQRSLQQTQRALEKREVKLDVLINGQLNPSEVESFPVPNSNPKQFVLNFALVNQSDEDAGQGLAEISLICPDCGLRLVGVDPWPYWDQAKPAVAKEFLEISEHSTVVLGRFAMFSDKNLYPHQVRITFRYRCLQCVPEESQFITVNLVG